MTRPSFDQAHATFERFLNTPFGTTLPEVAEMGPRDTLANMRLDRIQRTQSGPGANLGSYKPIFREDNQAQTGAEVPTKSFSLDRRNSSTRRSLDVSPGKSPLCSLMCLSPHSFHFQKLVAVLANKRR